MTNPKDTKPPVEIPQKEDKEVAEPNEEDGSDHDDEECDEDHPIDMLNGVFGEYFECQNGEEIVNIAQLLLMIKESMDQNTKAIMQLTKTVSGAGGGGGGKKKQ